MIRFIPSSAVLLMHVELIRDFGGKFGVRDRGLLESAMARPKNHQNYEQSDIYKLATVYCFGIIKNHPFFDGNKRVGLTVTYAFLAINHIELIATEEETTIIITGIADGSIDESTFVLWLKEHSRPI